MGFVPHKGGTIPCTVKTMRQPTCTDRPYKANHQISFGARSRRISERDRGTRFASQSHALTLAQELLEVWQAPHRNRSPVTTEFIQKRVRVNGRAQKNAVTRNAPSSVVALSLDGFVRNAVRHANVFYAWSLMQLKY